MERRGPASPPELPPLPGGPFLFISYASVDRDRVLAIAGELRAAGLDLWLDQAGITGGAAYGTEIATALKESAAVALMCSKASLASRNVRQEIMLAWRYDRPIVPLLLEPTTFPDDIAYWLEGAQWIEVLDRPAEAWLPGVGRALARHGIAPAPASVAHPASIVPSEHLAAAVPGNLPVGEGALIGRERETREVLALLGQGRWITLTGTGGTGKTRLALEAARRAAPDFPDGVWLVDLSALTDPDLVLPAMAAALEVAEEPGRPLLDVLTNHLAGKRVLLLLDNVEQVAAGVEPVSHLVNACEGLVVLATSRMPVQATGEWVYAVEPFALPDLDALPPLPVLAQSPAVQLFVARAREARPDFVLTEGMARPVAEICHRLDGLPLAIELAAARVRLLPPAAILTRLGSRLNLLTRGTAANWRQQTLRDTIAWSHGLLLPSEQAAFRRLSVFSGGATVEAGEAVLAATGGGVSPMLDDIAALVDHSLLRTESRGAEDAPRIRMLETIREYAGEQLEAHGEETDARSAHAAFFLDYATAHETDLLSPKPGPLLALLQADDDNLRAALDWLAGHPGSVGDDAELRMAAALIRYWRRLGRYQEAARRLDGALRRHPDGDPAARAKALQGAGFVAALGGDRAVAIDRFEAALALRREIGDREGEAHILQSLAEVAVEAGDFAEVQKLREQILAIWTEIGDEVGIATATHDLGITALFLGDYQTAIARFSEAIPLFRRWTDARNLAEALSLLSGAEMLSGHGDAVQHAEESLTLWRALDDRYATAYALVNLGRAMQLAGKYDEAIPVFDEGRAECEEHGDPGGISLSLYGLGMISLARHNLDVAFNQLSESLRLSHAAREMWHVAERLEAMAGVWAARGEAERAARLLGGAALIRESGGFPVPPAEKPDYDRTLAAIETVLRPDEVAAAMRAGRETPLDDLVAEALGERS